jgi:hypothetical protein
MLRCIEVSRLPRPARLRCRPALVLIGNRHYALPARKPIEEEEVIPQIGPRAAQYEDYQQALKYTKLQASGRTGTKLSECLLMSRWTAKLRSQPRSGSPNCRLWLTPLPSSVVSHMARTPQMLKPQALLVRHRQQQAINPAGKARRRPLIR